MTKTSIIYRGIELDVEYEIIKPYRGMRDSLGVPLEPDELAGIGIEACYHKGEDVTAWLDGQFHLIEKEIEESFKE